MIHAVERDPDVVELARLIDAAGHIEHAYAEAVGAMPGQGVSSVFAFGKVFGLALGILAANFIPHTLVTPQRWKRALEGPAEKDGARARASQLHSFSPCGSLVPSQGRWTSRSRLDRLEQATGDRRLMLVCCDSDETAEKAIAAHLADHPEDTGCEFVTVITGVPR